MRSFEMLDLRISSYALRMSVVERFGEQKRPTWVLLIALPLVIIAVLTAIIPGSKITAHNILHHLNFLPLMIAGMLFGWRGAGVSALFMGLVNTPLIVRHWVEWPMDAKDQIVELSIFAAAGLIAGYLSDRERAQRRDLERTRHELESVYLELRENIAEKTFASGRELASFAPPSRGQASPCRTVSVGGRPCV